MYDQYMGVIKALGFNFVPAEWGRCWGGIYAIAQFTALFSLLGCRYGGDCRESFGLPDLRGRVPMGWGQSPGTSQRVIGTLPGWHQHILSYSYMPEHTHSHTYTGGTSGGLDLSVRVASNGGGKKSVPDDGDYIAGPGNAFGAVQDNLFLDPADVTSKSKIGGVTVAGGGDFNNNNLTIGSTPDLSNAVYVLQPSQAFNYCICMEGIYPSRS